MRREFEDFLECGISQRGFLRVHGRDSQSQRLQFRGQYT